MRAVVKRLILLAIAGIVAILAAAAIWVYPDLSSMRAVVAASANSRYPRHVVRAFLAAEDPHFLENPARRQIGAASLVQQLVKEKNALPGRGISRQIKEVVIAAVIESTVPKTEIVAAYMDNIYLGSVRGKNMYGVPVGARAYFGREPEELTLAEAAILAGIVRSPRYYSPVDHPERAATRGREILDKMLALKFITDAEYASAIQAPETAATK
jgi:membrane peptidoglycan carboxypeptidase